MADKNPLEKEVERALGRMIYRHGGLCMKWVCPGFSGVPDRLVLLPGGRIVFVETKRPKGGKVSKLQKLWAKRLTELGFAHRFIYCQADINALEMEIADGKRPRPLILGTFGMAALLAEIGIDDEDPDAEGFSAEEALRM